MPIEVADLLDVVEAELVAARRAAAAAVDRAQAVRELRSLALAAGQRLQRPLWDLDDLLEDPDDDQARAERDSILARVGELGT